MYSHLPPHLLRKIPAAKKLVLIGTALIGLSMIAQAQQTEGQQSEVALSEMLRVTTLSEGITELVKNANARNANAIMETCQRLLPQLDDVYRVAMTYGDASLRTEAQRWYTKTRQILLDNLVIAQSRLGTQPVQPARTPSPIAVPTPPDTSSIVRSLTQQRNVELEQRREKENALAYSQILIQYLKQNYSKPNTIEERGEILKLIWNEAVREQYTDTALSIEIVKDQIYDKLGWSLNL